jgi:hypothetical protein
VGPAAFGVERRVRMEDGLSGSESDAARVRCRRRRSKGHGRALERLRLGCDQPRREYQQEGDGSTERWT